MRRKKNNGVVGKPLDATKYCKEELVIKEAYIFKEVYIKPMSNVLTRFNCY